jgi:hypothetical protein
MRSPTYLRAFLCTVVCNKSIVKASTGILSVHLPFLQAMPYLPHFLFACANRETRCHYMQRILDYIMWYWPGEYYPTREVYSAVGCIVFVLTWQSWAILAGILLTVVAAVIYKYTKERRYAVVLGICGWLPSLLLGIFLFWALVKMVHGFHAAVLLHRSQRDARRLHRRQERRREQARMREFNAALIALGVPDVEPVIEDSSWVDLEG